MRQYFDAGAPLAQPDWAKPVATRGGIQFGRKGARYFDPNLPTRTSKGSKDACGVAFSFVSGQRTRDARDYIGQLRADDSYAEVKSGVAQLDDVVVWKKYPGGSKWGHVGVVAMDASGDPVLVSLMSGKVTTVKIKPGAKFFRRVK